MSHASKLSSFAFATRYSLLDVANDTDCKFSAAQRRELIEFIESRLADTIWLDELARVVNLSPYHFSRQFKSQFGVAPYAFVTNRRVAKAQEMLRNTSVPLKNVALDCGYSDQSHFCRAFRKTLGVTPAQYRRSI